MQVHPGLSAFIPLAAGGAALSQRANTGTMWRLKGQGSGS